MAPTSQEELKLRLYDEDISKLGPADRFVKTLIEIPFAYQRLEALLFMCSLQNEFGSLKESFKVLEVLYFVYVLFFGKCIFNLSIRYL